MPTKNYNLEALTTAINFHTGGISTTQIFEKIEKNETTSMSL